MSSRNLANFYLHDVALGFTVVVYVFYFFLQVKLQDKTEYPYTHYASFLIRSAGSLYYYRVACHALTSRTYKYYSWRSGNSWSPSWAVIGSKLTNHSIESLTERKHKVSLVVHADDDGTQHSDSYLSQIESLAVSVPYLLLPAGAQNQQSNDSYRFPLPGAEWPSRKDTFHTFLGPMIIVGFNSQQSGVGVASLRKELSYVERYRKKFPWLIVMSQQLLLCPPNSTNSAQTISCASIFQLLTEFKVHLYIGGSSDGYLRTKTLPFTNSHTEGIVSVGLGVGQHKQREPKTLPTEVVRAHVSSIKSTLLNIRLDTPSSLCMDVLNALNMVDIDNFCIRDRTIGSRIIEPHTFSGVGGTYDTRVWLCLVIILFTIFVCCIVFRRFLYAKLCRYVEADGGPPVYVGKLLSV